MISSRRGAALALLGVGGALGLLALLFMQGGEQTRARSEAQGPNALSWRAGRTQRYAVALDSSFRVLGASEGAQTMHVRLLGTLEFHTLRVDAAGALVGMRLSSVESWVGGERRAEMERAYARPFRVRYTRDGLPTAFEFPAEIAREHRGVLARFVRTFQVSVRPGERWESREPHDAGMYEAAYARTAPSRWSKKKLRYLGDGTAKDADLPIVESIESFRVESGQDWIGAMTVHETVESKDRAGMAVEVTNSATLERLPESSTPDAMSSIDWGFVAGAPSVSTPKGPDTPALSREEGITELRKSVAGLDGAAAGKRSRWIHALRDLLISDPGLAAVLLEELRGRELTDRTRADLYHVFELAGTPASQAVLATVMQDPESKGSDGLRAIVAMAGVAHPTAASVDALWRTTQTDRERLVSTASLALGSAGGNLRIANDARYASLRAELLSAARTERESARRVSFVLALGNTHDRSLAREVVPMMDDENARVRSAAARTAGRLAPNDVAAELMARLETENNAVVRASLAGALIGWASPSLDAMATMRAAIPKERDEPARFQMVRMLSRNLEGSPDNQECLRLLLRTERSPRIRREIAEAFAAAKANERRTER